MNYEDISEINFILESINKLTEFMKKLEKVYFSIIFIYFHFKGISLSLRKFISFTLINSSKFE